MSTFESHPLATQLRNHVGNFRSESVQNLLRAAADVIDGQKQELARKDEELSRTRLRYREATYRESMGR